MDRKNPPEKTHLLRHLLRNDFPEARILSFAHNSMWLGDAPIKTTAEIGSSLSKEIKDNRSPRVGYDIQTEAICIPMLTLPAASSHYLHRTQPRRDYHQGGMYNTYTKAACCWFLSNICQALCRKNAEKILNDTSGIIFLGTPHDGSSVSTAGAVVARATGFLGSNFALPLALQSHGSNLSDLSRSFEEAKQLQSEKLQIISFRETKPTYIFGWLSLGLVCAVLVPCSFY